MILLLSFRFLYCNAFSRPSRSNGNHKRVSDHSPQTYNLMQMDTDFFFRDRMWLKIIVRNCWIPSSFGGWPSSCVPMQCHAKPSHHTRATETRRPETIKHHQSGVAQRPSADLMTMGHAMLVPSSCAHRIPNRLHFVWYSGGVMTNVSLWDGNMCECRAHACVSSLYLRGVRVCSANYGLHMGRKTISPRARTSFKSMCRTHESDTRCACVRV